MDEKNKKTAVEAILRNIYSIDELEESLLLGGWWTCQNTSRSVVAVKDNIAVMIGYIVCWDSYIPMDNVARERTLVSELNFWELKENDNALCAIKMVGGDIYMIPFSLLCWEINHGKQFLQKSEIESHQTLEQWMDQWM